MLITTESGAMLAKLNKASETAGKKIMSETYGSILSIRDLVKTYPNGTQALKGISFDVRRGEFLVVIGLSGSGKSTLLRSVNRLLEPTSGSITYRSKDGRLIDIATAEGSEILKVRRTVGMIFQHFNLIPRHSVLQNVLYGALGKTPALKSMLGLFSADDKRRASDYLRLVGIEDKRSFALRSSRVGSSSEWPSRVL